MRKEISPKRRRLAPTNAGYRAHYAEFERKVAQSIKASQPLSE